MVCASLLKRLPLAAVLGSLLLLIVQAVVQPWFRWPGDRARGLCDYGIRFDATSVPTFYQAWRSDLVGTVWTKSTPCAISAISSGSQASGLDTRWAHGWMRVRAWMLLLRGRERCR